MKIGVLSDTHGNVARTKTASALFKTHQVDTILHCGDIGGEPVLHELAAEFAPDEIPVLAVLGNVDRWNQSIERFPAESGVKVLGTFAEVCLGGKRIALVHGDDAEKLADAIESNGYDYVLTGHTHRPDNRQVGKTRVINPGAVHRAAEPSVAIIDLDRNDIQHITLLDGTLV